MKESEMASGEVQAAQEMVAAAKHDLAMLEKDVSTSVALYRRTLYEPGDLPVETRLHAADKLMEYARSTAPALQRLLAEAAAHGFD